MRAAWAAADPGGRGLTVHVAPFVQRMDLAYAAADLVLTRAGASTIAELTTAGVPAVLVPLQNATANHQAANARAAEAAGGAVMLDDGNVSGRSLAATAAPILGDPARLANMAQAMHRIGHPAAAEELAALVVEAAGRMSRDEFLETARARLTGTPPAALYAMRAGHVATGTRRERNAGT
jgi:UDP-N-acetylglucosamine--N-acetylmuramyl-(pentapeptide) pyrophosphoryl-undecaprenol N-acetylglucosamine transferase